MLTEEDGVDISALKRQGMTISETTRRTNHDRSAGYPIFAATLAVSRFWAGEVVRPLVMKPVSFAQTRTVNRIATLVSIAR